MNEEIQHTGQDAAHNATMGDAGLAPAPGRPPPLGGLASEAKDLKALRDAVVDAASVGAGLWFSYVFALLYFLISAGSITNRDLFLESPVKLPFLNVDLPLLGFFWLGPAIFLIVHTYVLLHFVLLAGKVGDFDAELQAQIADEDVRGRLRRQLPSNIFVQFLAGPREVRSGGLGSLLKLIAWISLVIGPIALLVFFELQFLPYHDERITCWHRIAVLADIVLLWMLWPSVARGQRAGLSWHDVRRGKIVALAFMSLAPALLVTTIATFPGEWLVDSLPSVRFIPWKDRRDKPWHLTSLHKLLVAGDVDFAARKPKSLWSNRIVLPGFDAIDHAKFDSEAKIEGASETVSLRARDLVGAVLINATLRKADFTAAQLQGAQLDNSDLRGAKFQCAMHEDSTLQGLAAVPQQCVQLQGASLDGAQLQGASLDGAQLQGASLDGAQLQRASLERVQLQGASLDGAQLQGAVLRWARLQRAVLDHAFLQGAWLDSTQLQGASLYGAKLWGATLDWTQLQGATLDHAYLKGALLYKAELQGASLDGAQLEGALFRDVFVWRADARKAQWKNTRLVNPETGPKRWPEPSEIQRELLAGKLPQSKQWSAESFEKLKKMIAEEVPAGEELQTTEDTFRSTMAPTEVEVKVESKNRRVTMKTIEQHLDPAKALEGEQELAKVWEVQAHSSPSVKVYEERLAEIWQTIGCAAEDAPYVIRALLVQLKLDSSPFDEQSPRPSKLALAFLDEKHCPGARGLTDAQRVELKEIRDSSPTSKPKK
jgi:uncharacterized protein YjbI with pentapeptide repeats